MSERELSKLRGVGDRLRADVCKPSHFTDDIFCLVVPTDSANYCLLDSQSLRIIRHQPSDEDLQNIQGTSGGVSAASPILKSYREIWRVKYVYFSVRYPPPSSKVAIPSLFMKDEDDLIFMKSG